MSFERVNTKKEAKKYNLEELVKGITKKNRYKETDWGSPVGNEVW